MNFDAFQLPLAHRFGWALIHFVWQGALVALVLKLTLMAFRQRSPNLRYAVACGAMLRLVTAPVITFLALPTFPAPSQPPLEAVARAQMAVPDAATEPGTPSVIVRVFLPGRASMLSVVRWLDAHLPALLLAWAGGVLLLSVRLGFGWWEVKRLAGAGSPLATAEWATLLAQVSARVDLARPVRLLESALVRVPTAVGWLRPAVLLPASTLTGLRPDELEWILAHELAHIRRRDYLVNLLQSVAETLLFYHPAVWWISDRIRVERELCCDDMVIAAGGDPVRYAGALATLETLRGRTTGMAMAANGGPLLRRVRRLLGYPSTDSASGVWVLGAAVGLACVLWCSGEQSALATQVSSESPNVAEALQSGGATVEPIAPGEFIVDPFTGEPVVRDPKLPQLFTRTYKVDPNSFLRSIREVTANSEGSLPDPGDVPSLLRAFMAQAGLSFSTNSIGTGVQGSPQATGKALFFNDRNGLLLVRATREELDIISQALAVILSTPPQVVIEIKFIELNDAEFQKIGLESLINQAGQESGILVTNRTGLLVPPNGTNEVDLLAGYALRGREQVTRGVQGTLTDAQFRSVLRAFEKIPGADLLAAPRVTTLSGRQARIEVAEVREILTADRLGSTFVPVGPSVDLIPHVLADGSIKMTLIPSITAFVGYDDPGPSRTPGADGLNVALPLPRFRVTQKVTTVVIPGGHTLVMTGFRRTDAIDSRATEQSAPEQRQVVIFVTPTVIDSAGNRVNPD